MQQNIYYIALTYFYQLHWHNSKRTILIQLRFNLSNKYNQSIYNNMIRKVFTNSFAFSQSVKIALPPVETYLLQAKVIPSQITVTREEVLQHYRQLQIMRKMEVSCDVLYKAKKIRGFCHLYLGQQAIAQGMDSVLTPQDPLIGAYRVHCQAYKRGYSVRQIVSQMFGKGNGATKGKGGSMHYYKKDTNFYGGNGIVGAQVPVGAGLAFALKYQNKKNVASIMFGDGAANQGQLFEAANMAKLWNLPALFICENNIYGMGTSVERSSMNPHFYTRGDRIPGIRSDGNNVFQVKQVMKFAKNYAIQKGPLFLEFMTYRYAGHSMSDPGTTYRTRDQVQTRRKTTDPLVKVEEIGIEHKLVTKEQLQKIEAQASDLVNKEIELAQKDPEVDLKQLMTQVYVDNQNHYIRGKLYEESQIPRGQQY